jgi:hypothetical protein
MADTVVLPAGFKADARYAIMTVAVIGEMLQGVCVPHTTRSLMNQSCFQSR